MCEFIVAIGFFVAFIIGMPIFFSDVSTRVIPMPKVEPLVVPEGMIFWDEPEKVFVTSGPQFEVPRDMLFWTEFEEEWPELVDELFDRSSIKEAIASLAAHKQRLNEECEMAFWGHTFSELEQALSCLPGQSLWQRIRPMMRLQLLS